MTTQLDIALHNAGPHINLAFSLDHGINTFRGRNGIGKTSAIDATVAGLGGKPALNRAVTLTDGTLKGSVSVGGVVALHIGKRLTPAGQPSVEVAGYGALHDVIDPGIIDPVKADAHRVRAILSMAPVAVTDAIHEKLGANLPRPPDDSTNVLLVAEHYRRMANEKALEYEHAALAAQAALSVLTTNLSRQRQVAPPGVTVEAAGAAVDAAVSELHRTQLLAAQRVETEARVASIRATLSDSPPDVEASEKAAVVAESALQSYVREVEDAQRVLAALQSKRGIAAAERDAACKAAEHARTAKRAWDEQRKAIDMPITGPVESDVVAAAVKVEEAKRICQDSRDAAVIADLQAEAGVQVAMVDVAETHARELRAQAQSIGVKLGQILAANGLDGLDVEDGRLFATLDGKRMLFADRLSFGQRARIALTIACRNYVGRAIPVDPAFWFGLQPKYRAELHALAVEMRVMLVTEEATDDDVISVGWGIAA
jgi:hypothetical protein